MKRNFAICLIVVSATFCACNNQPVPTQPTFSGMVTLDGFGEAVDTSYYKVWSDSSWQEFYKDTTINSTTYGAILDAYGNEYFYDSSGLYAGFELPQIYGENAIIFDSPLPSIPDTMIGGETYALQTTFSFQSTSYGLVDDETLIDTSTIAVPFGTFAGCPGIESNTAITSGGAAFAGSDIIYWLAKGPSDIEQQLLDFGYSIFMTYGVVNGKGWGVTFSKQSQFGVPSYIGKALTIRHFNTSSNSSTPDIHSIAPMILRGIIHSGPRGFRRSVNFM